MRKVSDNGKVIVPQSAWKHILYNSLGIVFLIIGIIGIVTPVLPTTVFFILASGFLLKSNPVLYRWLHRNRLTGAYLRVYTRGEGLSRKSKGWSIATLWITLLISGWFVRNLWPVLTLLAAVGVGVTWHIASIKPREISKEKLERHLKMMGEIKDAV